MHSMNYCSAAGDAIGRLTKNLASVALLNGMTWVLQIAGAGVVSMGGAGVMYLLLENVPAFIDPSLETFVPQPDPVIAIAGLVSAIMVWNFMSSFGMVSH